MSIYRLPKVLSLLLASAFVLCEAAQSGQLLTDDFNDNSIDSNKWTTSGFSVTEGAGIMQVLCNWPPQYLDQWGYLTSVPVPINARANIQLRRKVRLHYANNYYMAESRFVFGSLPPVSIRYYNMVYNAPPNYIAMNGFYICRNAANPHNPNYLGYNASDVSPRMIPVWDTWFWETIEYNPITGDLTYSIDDAPQQTLNIGQMPELPSSTLTMQFHSGGWWTGHYQHIDDLSVTQEQVLVTPKPEHVHNAADGRQSIKDFRLTPGGQCAFTFSTADPGAMCIVSWTGNLKHWFPLIHFNTTAQGTEVLDTPRDPSKFYRTTYLPSGVKAAESFDYPIGSGTVDEQIAPPRNDLYLASQIDAPFERGAISPDTANWYNIQDVGSYYPTFGGLHAGEDWNKGSGSADVGEPVKAIANGQVVDIRAAGASGTPSTSGYAFVVRHWLLNNDSVDSLYVHIAPDRHGGNFNTSGVFGDTSNFTYQVGDPVMKGSVIGVIGTVSAFPPHLHFEIRNKPINLSGSLWPNSTGNGYYGPTVGPSGRRSPTILASEVQAAFLLMQKDGIIDPSDFIDDHR